MKANPTALSSTSQKNIANIMYSFYAINFHAGDIQLVLDMLKFLVSGLVQMFIYLLALFKSEDRLGVVEDALEALYLVLFLIDQILHGAQQDQEPALDWNHKACWEKSEQRRED